MAQIIKLLLIVLLLPSCNLFIRNTKPQIYYTLPPKADSVVNEYLSIAINDLPNRYFIYGIIRNGYEKDRYVLSIVHPNKKTINRDRVQKNYNEATVGLYSNRCLYINKKYKIPLVIEDFDGEFVNQHYEIMADGSVMTGVAISLHHTFFMEFDMNNVIYKLSYSGY